MITPILKAIKKQINKDYKFKKEKLTIKLEIKAIKLYQCYYK